MITKNYIKMCEGAIEIQKAWKPNGWDFHIYRGSKDVGRACEKIKDYMKPFYLWLPTQEQLQEIMMFILGENFIGCAPIILNRKLEESLLSNGIYNWGLSYNELWLAFVMKEKYNKVWTDEKWV